MLSTTQKPRYDLDTPEGRDAATADVAARVSAARRYIMREHRVLGSVLQRMDIELECSTNPQTPIAATDCYKHIWLDVRKMLDLTDVQMVFIIIHETLHKALGHGYVPTFPTTGSTERDHMISNVAKDFVINKIALKEMGRSVGETFPVANPAAGPNINATVATFWDVWERASQNRQGFNLYDPSLPDDEGSDRVYERLVALMPKQEDQDQDQDPQKGGDQQDNQQGGSGQGGNKQKQGDSQQGSDPQDDEQGGDQQDDQQGGSGQGSGQGGGQQDDQQGGNGQGAGQGSGHGKGKTPDLSQGSGSGHDRRDMNDNCHVTPQKVPSASELATEETLTAEAVNAAIATGAKSIGDQAGWVQRVLSLLPAPSINPRTLLERYVRKHTAKSDYSMRRLRRSGMAMGMMLPTLRSEEIGRLVVIMDTSGSVTDEDIAQYTADISSVQKIMRPTEIEMIYCDAEVAGTQIIKRGKPLKLNPVGGGGTKFAPAFRYIDENKVKADLILYLTDGYGPEDIRPALRPSAPVVWLVYDGNDPFKPTFGNVVHINRNKMHNKKG